MTAVVVHPEVRDALGAGDPVVALETAVVTCGLPRKPWRELRLPEIPAGVSADEPANLSTGRRLERVVRDAGAVPATVGVLDGALHVGLSGDDLERLATDEHAGKASTRDLAALLSRGRGAAGTTVSATLHACTLARPHPIRVMATGGLGGVHRGWTKTPDVSADLPVLSRCRVCVVCAGAKTVLDGRATLEALETLGVPVVGYGTSRLPQFLALGDDDLPTAGRVDDPAAAAALCRAHWDELDLPSAVVLALPLPASVALDHGELEAAIGASERLAAERGVRGAALTPFLLEQLAIRTEGRSLVANLALLVQNALLAAEVATQMATVGPA